MTESEQSNYLTTAVAATENAVLADLAAAAAAVEVRDLEVDAVPDLLAISLPVNRKYVVMDMEAYQRYPRRKVACVDVEDPESFTAYVIAHKTAATTLWAKRQAGTVIAVLDDHEGGVDGPPGWGRHRAMLRMTVTEDWAHWSRLDGKFVEQARFAEHLDDGSAAIADPPAADMIALAQTFSAKRAVTFLSAARLQSGDVGLTYEETTTAKAGQKGLIEIPETLTLRLAPWEGCPEYEVAARFRYRINDGTLSLGYRMVRPDRVLRDAFGAVLAQIRADTELVPYLGVR